RAPPRDPPAASGGGRRAHDRVRDRRRRRRGDARRRVRLPREAVRARRGRPPPQRVLEVQGLRRENRALRGAIEQPALLDSEHPAMQRVLATARQVATSDLTVLRLAAAAGGTL